MSSWAPLVILGCQLQIQLHLRGLCGQLAQLLPFELNSDPPWPRYKCRWQTLRGPQLDFFTSAIRIRMPSPTSSPVVPACTSQPGLCGTSVTKCDVILAAWVHSQPNQRISPQALHLRVHPLVMISKQLKYSRVPLSVPIDPFAAP